jgi:hypothetical protein
MLRLSLTLDDCVFFVVIISHLYMKGSLWQSKLAIPDRCLHSSGVDEGELEKGVGWLVVFVGFDTMGELNTRG